MLSSEISKTLERVEHVIRSMTELQAECEWLVARLANLSHVMAETQRVQERTS